jgi:uncharacterized beta-barrel protein YwiB (DUF1934 family)
VQKLKKKERYYEESYEMKKDVLITIQGLQFEEQKESETIETISRGKYYKRNGNHYVLFEEAFDEGGETVQNILKFNENEMQLTKKGPLNTSMIFEKNRKNIANYNTPFGAMQIGIDARELWIKEESEKISLDVDYAMDINYEYLADCKISVVIESVEIKEEQNLL